MFQRTSLRHLVFVTLVLAVEVRSGDVLKCYICTSMDDGCETEPHAKIQPMACSIENMMHWSDKVKQEETLKHLEVVFHVDGSQPHRVAPKDMACSKMKFNVSNKNVTVRSCQTAKRETIDPCRAIQNKLNDKLATMEFCDLCEEDVCNGSSSLAAIHLLSLIGLLLLAPLRSALCHAAAAAVA